MGKTIFNIIVVLFITQIVAGPTLFLTVETPDKIEIFPESDSENNLNGDSSDNNVLFDNEYVNASATELIAGPRNTQFNSLVIITEDVLLGTNHIPPEH